MSNGYFSYTIKWTCARLTKLYSNSENENSSPNFLRLKLILFTFSSTALLDYSSGTPGVWWIWFGFKLWGSNEIVEWLTPFQSLNLNFLKPISQSFLKLLKLCSLTILAQRRPIKKSSKQNQSKIMIMRKKFDLEKLFFYSYTWSRNHLEYNIKSTTSFDKFQDT